MREDGDTKTENTRTSRLLWHGVVSGVLITGFLNPWDRGLYLSIINNRNFLLKENFLRPYQGLTQTLVVRSVSTGLYFPFEQMTRQKLDQVPISQNARNMAGGCLVGAMTAFVLNPLNLVKYHSWSISDHTRFMESWRNIYRNAGVLGFSRGCSSALLRDMIFGATFSGLRNQRKLSNDEKLTRLSVNALSCFVATTLSSPLNYSRNVQYATSSSKECPSILVILKDLRDKVYSEQKTSIKRLQSFQSHLRLGWGTARVAVGMSLIELLYSMLNEFHV